MEAVSPVDMHARNFGCRCRPEDHFNLAPITSRWAADPRPHRSRGNALAEVLAVLFFCLSLRATVPAQTAVFPTNYPITFSREGSDFHLILQQNSAVYFGLQYSPDLSQPFTTTKMALGTPGPDFVYTPHPSEAEGFFRVEAIPVYAPLDSDHDGMDDIWELQHGLNPLDPSDASQPSAEMPGLTNVEYYQLYHGLSNQKATVLQPRNKFIQLRSANQFGGVAGNFTF